MPRGECLRKKRRDVKTVAAQGKNVSYNTYPYDRGRLITPQSSATATWLHVPKINLLKDKVILVMGIYV